jgi:hypothetical protein
MIKKCLNNCPLRDGIHWPISENQLEGAYALSVGYLMKLHQLMKSYVVIMKIFIQLFYWNCYEKRFRRERSL